jgi:hypothetical protein
LGPFFAADAEPNTFTTRAHHDTVRALLAKEVRATS